MPPDTLSRLQQFSQQTSSNLFLGVATSSANSSGFNSVVEISPDAGGTFARYDKRRLMPFGEYAPAGFHWFASSLSISLKDLSEGASEQAPLFVGAANVRTPIGTLICQEDLIGRDARSWASAATLILNPSNLAWFDNSLAIEQRLQIVQMRAAEIARPVLRIANTGVTASIDAHGRVLDRLPAQTEGTLSGKVQPMTGLTPYARLGDALPIAICIVALLFAGWSCRLAMNLELMEDQTRLP